MSYNWVKGSILQGEGRRSKLAKRIRNTYLLSTIVAGSIFMGSLASSCYFDYKGRHCSDQKERENYAQSAARQKTRRNCSSLALALLASHWGAYLYGARRRHKR